MPTIRMVDSSGTWDVLDEDDGVLGRIKAGKYLTFDPILGEFVTTLAVVDGVALYAQSREMGILNPTAYEPDLIGRFGRHGSSYALFMGRTEQRCYLLREVNDVPDTAQDA